MTWHKEYDETYQTHYYYNDETGESRWDTPADDDADAEGLVAPADDDAATRVRRRGSCDDDDASDGDASDASDDGDELLAESRASAAGDRVYAETEETMKASRAGAHTTRRALLSTDGRRYTCIFYFHACLCEGPFAALEAAGRAVCYAAAARPPASSCLFSRKKKTAAV